MFATCVALFWQLVPLAFSWNICTVRHFDFILLFPLVLCKGHRMSMTTNGSGQNEGNSCSSRFCWTCIPSFAQLIKFMTIAYTSLYMWNLYCPFLSVTYICLCLVWSDICVWRASKKMRAWNLFLYHSLGSSVKCRSMEQNFAIIDRYLGLWSCDMKYCRSAEFVLFVI